MPDSKARRREKLKKILEEQKRKLWQELRGNVFGRLGEEYRREFERAMDAGDLSVVDLLESVDVQRVNIRQQELRKLLEAERKLREGTYGICESCGGEISEERLRARPVTTLCIDCKTEEEVKERL